MKAPLLIQCKPVAFLGALFLMPGLSLAGVIGSLPYIIKSSGNYELESSLTYAGQTNAIEVKADNVVINLNGFSINNTGNGVFGVLIQKMVRFRAAESGQPVTLWIRAMHRRIQ